MRKRPVAEQIARRLGKPIDRAILEALQAGQSFAQIAAEWDVEAVTVRRWADAYGIRSQWVAEQPAAGPSR